MGANGGLRVARSPGRQAAPARRTTARWRAPVALAGVAGGLAAAQLTAFTIVTAARGHAAPEAIDGVAAVVAALVLLGAIWAVAQRGARPLTATTMGVRRTALWPALGWTLALMVGIAAAEGAYSLVTGVGGQGKAAGGPMTTAGALLLVAGVAVLVPIAEEVAFRGYLFPALARWSGPWTAAIMAAVVFAAAHVLACPPEALPALTFFGFGACLLYWMTGSLLPCIGLHALNNGMVMATTSDVAPVVAAAALLAPVIAIAVCWPFARGHTVATRFTSSPLDVHAAPPWARR